MKDTIIYKINNGKPCKILFFTKEFLKMAIPKIFYRKRRNSIIEQAKNRSDYDYITERVNYYNKLTAKTFIPNSSYHERQEGFYHFIDKIKYFKRTTFHNVYYFDLQDVMRWFCKDWRIYYLPGDVYFTPKFPALVKSRLLNDQNQNSIILKLDKLRHFMFVNDTIPFSQKENRSIFRGKIRHSRLRYKFMEMYFGSKICDCGVVGKNEGFPKEWITPKKTIKEHLNYKFIISLEGNDVASNLKWVMSSNSIAVMTRPTCETWFMEGKLIPNYHYILIKDDLSDLEEKLNYYISHPQEAEDIITHAHEYVKQFLDNDREELIQILVANKYFNLTKQQEI